MRIQVTLLGALIGAAVSIGLPTPVRAALLTFDFSFTGNENGPGASGSATVTGELTGLQDNTANQAVTDIEYTSYPTGFMPGLGSPPISFPAAGSAFTDSVSVSGGQITAIQIDGLAVSPFVSFDFSLSSITFNDLVDSTEISGGGPTYTEEGGSSPTPEPASLTILGVAFAGLALIRRRRASPLVAC